MFLVGRDWGGGGCGGGVIEDFKEDGTLAFGTSGILFWEHDIHKATGTTGHDH